MTDKPVEEATDEIEISQEESGTPEEEKAGEGGKVVEAGKEPSERMTKKELLELAKELKDKLEESYDRYLRAQAEIDNVLKRNKKEKEEWVKFSNERLIKELLPVMDNLEKAISHAKEENSLHALREGVELTLKGLKDTLMKSGLEEVEAKGKPFDPCFHHAVSEQEDENVEAGIVLDELQKGYTLNQRLVRPAMVVLSGGKSDGNSSRKEKGFDRGYEDKNSAGT
jgi:molecular chaperone GrpE